MKVLKLTYHHFKFWGATNLKIRKIKTVENDTTGTPSHQVETHTENVEEEEDEEIKKKKSNNRKKEMKVKSTSTITAKGKNRWLLQILTTNFKSLVYSDNLFFDIYIHQTEY